MNSYRILFVEKHFLILLGLSLLSTLFSCEIPSDYNAEVENINAIYNCADGKVAYNLDSAIVLLDSGLYKATSIKHDSLIVAGLFFKANCRAKQGDMNYADSVYNVLIYGNKYKVDSLILNKIKLRYAHLNYLGGTKQKLLTYVMRLFLFLKEIKV